MTGEDLDLVYSPPKKWTDENPCKDLFPGIPVHQQTDNNTTASQFKLCLSFAIDLCLAMDV